MDLIYTNENREDVGVLFDYSFDLAFGIDENDFECKLPIKKSDETETPAYLYIEGTEYGGIIDSIKSNQDEIVLSGRTWHGILNSKVIKPDSGEDYLVLSGEANTVIGTLLSRMGLTELFSVSTEDSGITLSNYQMDRYILGYDGIRKMLESVGGKLRFKVESSGNVLVSAALAVDYSQSEEFDSDLVDFEAKKSTNTVNHLVCLGQGELSERTVIHLYADENGNISTTQTQTGLLEYEAVYDYSNVESAEELEAKGREKLRELWKPNEIEINFGADEDRYDIGDKVGATDNIIGVTASGIITKKIVTIQNGRTTISYKVGE